MSVKAIRQAIYDILKAVPDIGQVYDYERWNADLGQFISLFQDKKTGRILGWEITRVGNQAAKLSAIEESTDHVFVIHGYMGLQDAARTDLLFDDLVETVRAAFRGNHTLAGACLDAGPATAPVIDKRFFGNVLCHHAEIRLPVNEILTA